MGWTQTWDVGKTKPYLISEMEQGGHYKVLDYSAKLHVAFMAVECLTDFPYGKGRVFATITLIHRSRDGSITTKDLSESMGVDEYDCPERLLDKLSPTEELYGPVLYKQQCDVHYDCRWAEDPNNTGFSKPHVNQRTVADGSRAWADKWRQECRERIAARRARPKLTDGAIFRIKSGPIKFTSGAEYDTFRFLSGAQRNGYRTRRQIRAYPSGQLVRLNPFSYDFELVAR